MSVDEHSYPNTRIYFQMRPNTAGLQHLTDLQRELPEQLRGRLASARGLHLTLIHFGKAHDVYDSLRPYCNISYARYAELLQQYIEQSNCFMPDASVRLQSLRMSRFGVRGGTLVVEYEPTPELLASHQGLFETLRSFLEACGIQDLDEFIAQDRNFMHAPVLRPHITLYKGYQGELPALSLEPVTVYPMQTVYPPLG